MDFTHLRLLVLDVDGVLTDGRISASPKGDDAKWFHVQDGCAIKRWQKSGGIAAILSGRRSTDVLRRGEELGITLVRTGVEDKSAGLTEVLRDAGLSESHTAYVGDDFPDLEAMRRCGFPVAVGNAVPDVKRAARYVTRRRGGDGAVAEVIEFLLRGQRRWNLAASMG